MGWWKTGYKDDLMGDLPADSVTDFWEKLDEKPLWPMLIAVTIKVIEQHKDWYEDSGEEARKYLTEREWGDISKYSVLHHDNLTFLSDLEQLLRDLTRTYQQHIGRKPRSSEIVAGFRILGK